MKLLIKLFSPASRHFSVLVRESHTVTL